MAKWGFSFSFGCQEPGIQRVMAKGGEKEEKREAVYTTTTVCG